jgi:hypothetical protein
MIEKAREIGYGKAQAFVPFGRPESWALTCSFCWFCNATTVLSVDIFRPGEGRKY